MKKRVFISGITGTMGKAGLKHLLKYPEELEIIALVQDTKRDREIIKSYDTSAFEIVWGDLRNYQDVKKALVKVDYILHIAALVSPAADYYPQTAFDVNVGSVDNILRAIKELGLEDVKLVYIASVAETGSRLPPLHWGRVGDPLKPSIYDNYAITKIKAERKIIESGLKYWVSLRQTGILHYGLLNIRDGIIFHQPLRNVLEWVTEDDSGRLLANLCIKDLPQDFWKNIYNVGGGESCRKNNYEFTSLLLKAVGVNDIQKIFEPSWFATDNFHGQYYLDSDILNDYLDFRRESIYDFTKRLAKEVTYPAKLLKYIPNIIIKHLIMKPIAKSKQGTLNWIENQDRDKIKAFYGSLENYRNIKDWDSLDLTTDYDQVIVLDHGYDESKDQSLLDLDDLKQAASFRGGKCLSKKMRRGDLDTKLCFECSQGHQFLASPNLVLKAGHWCDVCSASPWNYDQKAKNNPFFAQVWKYK